MTTAAVPLTGPGPWVRRTGRVTVLVAAASCVPGDALVLLTAVAVVLVAGREVLRRWAPIASGLLPAAERAPWRAEVRAVLAAAQDGRERRRQLRGFALGLPACAVTSWRLALRRG